MHGLLPYFGYIRVSTLRQGDKGVSLPEQRDAILQYAERRGFQIARWYEERETAAKRGRPVLREMLAVLRAGKAQGVIVHKVDRGARNSFDWAELESLVDEGFDVRFAAEDLDLRTRGGRLTANIQAVVAADFSRNNREEARKGFYGRIKQGLYPMPAPIGYVDQGAAKPKTPDPERADFARLTFEYYGSGKYSFVSLRDELYRLGLRTRRGGKLSLNGLSIMLRNPFYIGLIRIRRTGETFPGIHEPLVSTELFNRVQDRLDGKVHTRGWVNTFLFRQLLRCKHCEYALVGERQKGHVYYRCHTSGCPTKGVREESVEASILSALGAADLGKDDRWYIESRVESLRAGWKDEHEGLVASVKLRLERTTHKLDRLTDAFLEGALDREEYARRKEALLVEQRGLEEQKAALRTAPESTALRMREFLELVSRPSLLYQTALPAEKRALVEITTSNRAVDRKHVEIALAPPFSLIAERTRVSHGAPYRNTPRTLDRLFEKILTWFRENPTATFPSVADFSSKDTSEDSMPKQGKRAA